MFSLISPSSSFSFYQYRFCRRDVGHLTNYLLLRLVVHAHINSLYVFIRHPLSFGLCFVQKGYLRQWNLRGYVQEFYSE